MSDVVVTLSADERRRLAQLEKVIERGMTTYVEVGMAAAEIRESRLYRESHATWEAYCRDRWQEGHRELDRRIEHAQLVNSLGDMSPKNERQARELVRVEPERRAEVWQHVVDAVPAEQITAKVIRQTAEAVGAVEPTIKPVSRSAPGGASPETLHRLQLMGAVRLLIVHDGVSEADVRKLFETAIEAALVLG